MIIWVAEVSLLPFLFQGMHCAAYLIIQYYALLCPALKAQLLFALEQVVVTPLLRVELLNWVVRRFSVTLSLGSGPLGHQEMVLRLRNSPLSAGLLTLLRTPSSSSSRTLLLMSLLLWTRWLTIWTPSSLWRLRLQEWLNGLNLISLTTLTRFVNLWHPGSLRAVGVHVELTLGPEGLLVPLL